MSSIGSASFENKSNPPPSIITGLPNIRISIILIGAEAQSSATSRPPEQAEWQTLAHLIILVDFVINIIDAEPKYPQITPLTQPSAFLPP